MKKKLLEIIKLKYKVYFSTVGIFQNATSKNLLFAHSLWYFFIKSSAALFRNGWNLYSLINFYLPHSEIIGSLNS